MELRIVSHEKRTDLSYELPHRVRCSAVYPLQAPNDSTVVLYGYERGLRVLWCGGRRPRTPQPTQQSQDTDVIILDDSDDSTAAQPQSAEQEHGDVVEGEIVHDITIPLASAVSRIAVPQLSAHWPSTAQQAELDTATITVATISGQVLVLRVPLQPQAQAVEAIAADAVVLEEQSNFVRDISMRYFGKTQTGLYIAAVSKGLDLWRFDVESPANDIQHLNLQLDATPLAVSFHPASRSPLLLVVGSSSTCRTFEPPLDWTAEKDINEPNVDGTWLAALHAPFASTDGALPARKRILDASWLLQGKCILALFDDGAWGVWDTTASLPDKSLEDFVVGGYLDSVATSDTEAAPSVKRAGVFAPMTPNTRKAKSTALFAPQRKSVDSAVHGGITVARSHSSAGNNDESVLIWYGSDVYAIPSTQAFWQRSTSRTSGLGSLSAPGIARVQSLNLFHERITSISQLPASPKIIRTPDFVLSAETRLVIVQQTTPPSATFMQKLIGTAEVQDQRMLDAGELDLGGMDRILSTMDTAKPRKVGFAH